MALDPSLTKAGYAVFRLDPEGMKAYLTEHGVFKSKKKLNVEEKWVSQGTQVKALFQRLPVRTQVWCEKPGAWAGSIRGQAALNSGALLGLAGWTGFLSCLAGEMMIPFHLVEVRTWKGNVPKRITYKRMSKRWGVTPEDDNAADAIGIGTWALTRMLGYTPGGLDQAPPEITSRRHLGGPRGRTAGAGVATVPGAYERFRPGGRARRSNLSRPD